MHSTAQERIWILIPALNEERSIGLVLGALFEGRADPPRVIVCDNGSTDRTVAPSDSTSYAPQWVRVRRRGMARG